MIDREKPQEVFEAVNVAVKPFIDAKMPQTPRHGGPIRGRRRNGFCSDKCRLRATRAEQAERVEGWLADIEALVVQLRRHNRWGPDGEEGEHPSLRAEHHDRT